MMGSTKYLPMNYGEKESADHFTKLSNTFEDKYFQYAFLRFLQKRDITLFNPRKYKKNEFHQLLVDSSRDPLIGFLADYMKDKKGTVKICGSYLLSQYSFYLKERNYKLLEQIHNIRNLVNECCSKSQNIETKQNIYEEVLKILNYIDKFIDFEYEEDLLEILIILRIFSFSY